VGMSRMIRAATKISDARAQAGLEQEDDGRDETAGRRNCG
jgi:hypothetical protein